MALTCPPGYLDEDAINLALTRLPKKLQNEYRGKLVQGDYGTVLELAYLGRLLQKDGPLSVRPWPAERRVDAQLRLDRIDLELEIKASIATRYDNNVKQMCREIETLVKERWPHFQGEVCLHNDFHEQTTPEGKTTLDTQATIKEVMEHLTAAIGSDGRVAAEYKERAVSRRLVTVIQPHDSVYVWMTSWTVAGTLEIDIIARTMKGALDDKHQFTGDCAAILAVIQARDPRPRILHTRGRHLSREYFGKYSHLSAIVCIPCPSTNGPPVILTPDADQASTRAYPISAADAMRLAEFLAVRLQVDAFWDEMEAELRKEIEQLEKHRPLIQQLLDLNPEVAVKEIAETLRAAGYEGSSMAVYGFVAKLRDGEREDAG